MSPKTELYIPLTDTIGDEAAQAATRLARTLLLGQRSVPQTCSCVEPATGRCQVTAENDRMHVEYDPNRRCPACGARLADHPV